MRSGQIQQEFGVTPGRVNLTRELVTCANVGLETPRNEEVSQVQGRHIWELEIHHRAEFMYLNRETAKISVDTPGN